MKKEPKMTPLLELLRALETQERQEEFAALCSTSRLYLYQIAGCHRKACRADKALAIEEASKKLSLLYGTPVVTMQQLGSMCSDGGCTP